MASLAYIIIIYWQKFFDINLIKMKALAEKKVWNGFWWSKWQKNKLWLSVKFGCGADMISLEMFIMKMMGLILTLLPVTKGWLRDALWQLFYWNANSGLAA